jgi:hypothetical protein
VLVGDAFILENAQDMREGVHVAESGEVARVPEGFLGDCGEVEVFDGRVGDFWRLEQFSQRFEPGVGNFGDADAGFHLADAGRLMDAGQDSKQRRLAHHWQADNGSFHRRFD